MPRHCVLVGALMIACALIAWPVQAQVATAPTLKAAFLFNFVKFTTWPASVLPEGAAFTLCVVGDPEVAQALDQLTNGQRVGDRGIVLARLNERDDARRCHLLYASNLRVAREQTLIDAARDNPILTVSDSDRFIERGGIAAFHVAAGKMRFAVNPTAASRVQLRISSRLLSLAVISKEEDHVTTH